MITFTKFEELQPADEFATPPSSPSNFSGAKIKEGDASSSWYSWVRGARGGASAAASAEDQGCRDEVDPFLIPRSYTWVDANEKKRRMKAKKSKSKRAGKKPPARGAETHQTPDGLE